MSKKKLIRKMALPAAIAFAVSIIIMLLFDGPIENNWNQQRTAKLNAHMNELAQKSQTELTQIAGRIAAAGAAEIGASRAVAELQSELLRENQLNGGGTFCPHCGFDLSTTYCPQCQYPVKAEWSFCPNCRAGLTQRTSLEATPEQLRLSESSHDSTTSV
ncbi:MAG: zinc ribbon domain-containing protein [bacterium]